MIISITILILSALGVTETHIFVPSHFCAPAENTGRKKQCIKTSCKTYKTYLPVEKSPRRSVVRNKPCGVPKSVYPASIMSAELAETVDKKLSLDGAPKVDAKAAAAREKLIKKVIKEGGKKGMRTQRLATNTPNRRTKETLCLLTHCS